MFELYSPSGQLLQQIRLPENTLTHKIDLSTLQGGIYFYTLRDEHGGFKSGKVIKI
jgi:hypothetical protein